MSALPRADVHRDRAGPQRRPARPPPPRRLALAAHPRPRDRRLPHHRLQGVLPARPADLGHPGAPRRGHARRHRTLPRPLALRLYPHATAATRRRGSPGAARSSTSYAVTSRPAPACCSSPARRASGRPRWSPRFSHASARSSASGAACRCRPRCRLLPVADALRRLSTEWMTAVAPARPSPSALRTSPVALARLLPEARRRRADDEHAGRATALPGCRPIVLRAMAATRPVALLIEDLHWADAATLDLLEHLLAAGPGAPTRRHLATRRPSTPRGTSRSGSTASNAGCRDRRSTSGPVARRDGRPAGPASRSPWTDARRPDPPQSSRSAALHRTAGVAGGRRTLPRVLSDLLDRRVGALGPEAGAVVNGWAWGNEPLPTTL